MIIFTVNFIKRPFKNSHKKVKLDRCNRSYVYLKMSGQGKTSKIRAPIF